MIQISQVYANDSNSLKFIERIYTESFPPDERRDFSDVIRLLEENDDFFIVLLSDENKAVGFISYWEWNDFSYVEHFAVDSSCEDRAMGQTAMTELLKRITIRRSRSRKTIRRYQSTENTLLRTIGFRFMYTSIYPTAIFS